MYFLVIKVLSPNVCVGHELCELDKQVIFIKH